MKLAAIDVGSNGVRLLTANVYETGDWKPLLRKADLYRVPVRLGSDAFLEGEISSETEERFIKTMVAFRNLIEVCQVDDTMACATSALRSAVNGQKIAERVRSETGIDLQIISGTHEAEFIALNRLDARFSHGAFLFIDVGGGSTELTLHANGRHIAAKSFKIGTVRLKEQLVEESAWEEMQEWVTNTCASFDDLDAIGSGGNINKLFKLTNKNQKKPLKLKRLQALVAELSKMGYEERMIHLGMRPDRSDVIVPAGGIYSNVMSWAGCQQIFVPQIGLADGIIHYLYRKHRSAK